jgi:WD40 repeat protein
MNKLTLLSLLLLSSAAFCQSVEWSEKANPINNAINSVAFKSDGQQVMSGTNCHPASIRIFDVTDGSMEWDFTVGSNYMCIMGVTFSSNSNYLAAIEEFGNIFIFDNSGTSPVIIDTINTGTSWGFATAISPSNDKVAVGCSDGKLKIYNLADGSLSNDINAHTSWVTSVAYSADSLYLISGGSDDLVKIWNTAGVLQRTLSGHSGDITNVKVSPDNNFVISSSKDNSIKIWNLSTGALVRTLTGHSDDVNSVDISPDGSRLVSGSSDNSCKIWNFSDGSVISTFGVVDSGAVYSVAWSPIDGRILTGNSKSDLTLWNASSVLNNSKIEQRNNDLFELYPNPAIGHVNIYFGQNSDVSNISIYDLNGKLLKRIEDTKSPFNLQDFAPGIYIVQAKINGMIKNLKLVKQ